MKTIGMIGGMSWESSLEYYRILNEQVKEELGGTHSCQCLMYSFDFEQVEKLQHDGRWDELTNRMVAEAENLKKAGADFIVICTNTMHRMAPDIEGATGLKVLHIAEATGKAIVDKDLKKVALLGTEFTMTGDFYHKKLRENFGIEVMIPGQRDRREIHRIIYEELILGQLKEDSREIYKKIIEKLALEGAEGVILGCTEIPLLIQEGDVSIPVFDTTELHAKAAVMYALDL